jgi:dCMP deaminase
VNFQPSKWDLRFLELAAFTGGWSKDTSAKTGCVFVGVDMLVRSSGFNGFVRGVDDTQPQRHDRPAKYFWTEHAERNAIFNAARVGISLVDTTCYVNWFPCIDCARAIIQVGARRLVGLEPNSADPKWGTDFELATVMFKEVGLQVDLFNIPRLGARAITASPVAGNDLVSRSRGDSINLDDS